MKINHKLSPVKDDSIIQRVLDEDGSLYHLPSYSDRYQIKFKYGKGSGKWLKSQTVRDFDDWGREFMKSDPITVEKSMEKFLDESNTLYDRSTEMSNNAFYSIKDIDTGKIIAESDYGNEIYSFNSRHSNNRIASVDIDLNHGFTIGDLTVKVEGDSIIVDTKDSNGMYANESLKTKDPIYAIKTILSHVSNWV